MKQLIELSLEQLKRLIWVLMAQYGAEIKEMDAGTGAVLFTVPSSSTYMAEDEPYVADFAQGDIRTPVSGDFALEMISHWLRQLGFYPEGVVRQEYWTRSKGELAAARAKLQLKEKIAEK